MLRAHFCFFSAMGQNSLQIKSFCSPGVSVEYDHGFNFLQAGFFMTYVLTSGWASLSFELVQVFALLCNCFTRFILKKDPSNETPSFPYHTEIPRVLLFGLLGFTCSILAPIILPILLVYFFLAYLVYRNQVNSSIQIYSLFVHSMVRSSFMHAFEITDCSL